MMGVLKLFLLGISLVVLVGCGYKPSSKYAREVVGEKISTSVVISAQDPENTVVIKDAVDAAILESFHSSLVDKKYSTTHLTFSISAPSYSPIQYNIDGYIITYRASIRMGIIRESDGEKKKYTARGTYDFNIEPNAVVTDQERFNAIKYSSAKAIASFVAQISAEGTREKKD
jgi:hypothetical protein